MRAIDDGNVVDAAQVVKLVDTPASGAGDRKVVEVRVFSWAPNSDQTRESGFFRFRPLIFNGKIDLYFSNQGFTDQKPRRIVRPINSGNVVR